VRGKKNGSGQPAMNGSKQAGMGKRIIVVWLVTLIILSFAPFQLPEAQQPVKVATIGWLEISGLGIERELFGRGLRELSHVERKKITIEDRSANDKIDRLPALGVWR
jgi:hypothetical protein